MVFPLWYVGYNPQQAEDHTLWLLPYFHKRRTNASEDWLFPLFHWETGQSRTCQHDAKQKESGNTVSGDYENLSVLWPLYRREVQTDPQGKIISRYRRFLLFSDELEEDGGREFRVLGIPITERH
jgi:predicted amidohydrolase